MSDSAIRSNLFRRVVGARIILGFGDQRQIIHVEATANEAKLHLSPPADDAWIIRLALNRLPG